MREDGNVKVWLQSCCVKKFGGRSKDNIKSSHRKPFSNHGALSRTIFLGQSYFSGGVGQIYGTSFSYFLQRPLALPHQLHQKQGKFPLDFFPKNCYPSRHAGSLGVHSGFAQTGTNHWPDSADPHLRQHPHLLCADAGLSDGHAALAKHYSRRDHFALHVVRLQTARFQYFSDGPSCDNVVSACA